MKKQSGINISLYYSTNISPILGSQQINALINSNNTINNKLFSKNFFLFLFFVNFKKTKNNFSKFSKITIFVKPKKVKKFTLLRAPYRYKVGRVHLMYSRYTFVVSFSLPLVIDPQFNTINALKNYNTLIEKSLNSLTTKINTLYRYKYNYNCTYKNLFLVSLYF